MASDQFQIPGIYNQSELRAEINSIHENLQNTLAEKENSPFSITKDLEGAIFAHRESLLGSAEAGAGRGPRGWLKGLVFAPNNPTMREIIDKESYFGETIFGEGSRFWLDCRPANAVFSTDVADWYYMTPSLSNPKKSDTIRFQTTPNGIHKLYDGVEYPLNRDELETFFKAVHLYANMVTKES